MAQEMILKLNTLGMTSLHKAGLAGLYMTLQAFAERGERITGLDWTLEPTQITLRWQEDKPKAALERLVAKSFWLDKDGFIRLTGLEAAGEPSVDKRHHLYIALTNSFLQFGPHRPTESKRSLSYEVDEKVYWIKDFAPIKELKTYKTVADDFVDEDGAFNQTVEAASWLYPGGSVRHNVHKKTALREPLGLALALLFAPVGVIYFNIKSNAKKRKARLAMLIPEVRDLERYAEVRQILMATKVIDLTASSASDAALRMLTLIEAHRAGKQLASINGDSFRCRIITFGIVGWNEKQKSRTSIHSIYSGSLSGLANYYKASAIFKNRWQRVEAERDRSGNVTKPERYFITTFSARELIADNIAQGKSWYHDLAQYMSQKETREQLLYEQKELHEMVNQATYEDERELTFIRACHESWRRRLGKLGERARREKLGDAGFQRLASKEAEKLRTTLARSKNAQTLRETVVDFWARAGSIPQLQGDGLVKLLPLFNESNWRKTRDLALLALISYSDEEAKSLTANPVKEEGEK